jgi:hypothetical protein
MAIPRKRALNRLQSLLIRVEKHIDYISSDPGNIAVDHWKHETRNWLQQMQEMLPHVGKKTSSKWETLIKAHQAKLGE